MDPALVQIAARYSHRYDRPHAVVEAEGALLADLRAAGYTVEIGRFPGKPYERRYGVGAFSIVGTVDVPNSAIRLRVEPAA